MPRIAKKSPCGVDSRPEGSGRPAVRAMSASRPRSCTWFSAEAPQDKSMTPSKTSSPCAHGNSGPSGALNMNPAPADTSTSRTIPNLDSSA
jgi:hypothetical protein